MEKKIKLQDYPLHQPCAVFIRESCNLPPSLIRFYQVIVLMDNWHVLKSRLCFGIVDFLSRLFCYYHHFIVLFPCYSETS